MSLAYELHRPLLTPDSEGSATLRALLATDIDDVASFSNDTCLRKVRDIVQELTTLLEMPEVSETLRQRLASVTPVEARQLVDVWRGMSCRSASLIEFSPLLTRLLNCNTAPLPLGAGQTAKGAGLYMCKYMVKEAYALAASLSVLLDARKHIEAYPSKADDSGATGRTSKHFLQRVLNSTTAELAPTQAAAIVLGIPSQGHSHAFVFACAWDAARLTDILSHGGAFLSDAVPAPAAAAAVTAISPPDPDPGAALPAGSSRSRALSFRRLHSSCAAAAAPIYAPLK